MKRPSILTLLSLVLIACGDAEKIEELEEELEELADELEEATEKGEVACERVYEDYPFEGWSSDQVEAFFDRRTPGGTLVPVASTSRYDRGEIKALYYCYEQPKKSRKNSSRVASLR